MAALIISIVAILGDVYCVYLFLRYQTKGTLSKRSMYRLEFEEYFEIMRELGFKDKETAEKVLEFKTYEDLRNHNRKAKELLKL